MFENPRIGRQATEKFYNKCSKDRRSQIAFRTDIFRKFTLGAPDVVKTIKCWSQDISCVHIIIFPSKVYTPFCKAKAKSTVLSYRSNIDFKHGTSVAFLL